MAKIDKLLEYLEREAENSKKKIDETADKLKINPWHAAEWMTSLFDHVAIHDIYGRVAAGIRARKAKGEENAQDIWISIKKWAYQRMVGKNSVYNRSTSPCSNMLEDAAAKAHVQLYDMMEHEWNWED